MYHHQNAGVENVRLGNVEQKCRAGKCRTGKWNIRNA